MKLRLIGNFSVIDEQDVDRTPRASKARAVLAMLAAVPDFCRSRRWLEAHLWSDRGADQASGSLRQVLVEIRKAFGPHGDRLKADREKIWLDDVVVDHLMDKAALSEGREFLEGLDVSDPEFEDWLTLQRARYGGLTSAVVRPGRHAAETLAFTLRVQRPADQSEGFISHALANAIGCLVSEFVDVDIFSPHQGSAQVIATERGFMLIVDAMPGADCIHILVSLATIPGNRIYWSHRASLAGSASDIVVGKEYPQIVFQAVDAAYAALAAFPRRSNDEVYVDGLLAAAVRNIFTFERTRLREADKSLAEIIALAPSARAYAWRAQLRQIAAIERTESDWALMTSEAHEFAIKALEFPGASPLVFALTSQIKVMLDNDPDTGIHLAEEALAASPYNAFGHAARSSAWLRTGDYNLALEAARTGAQISGRSAFAPWWQALAGLSAMSMGRHDEATAHYQAAHARAPSFRAPLRHLYFLYLASGKTEKATRILQNLRRVEPDFSFFRVRDDMSYPATTLRRSGLIAEASRHL